jgi:hypothetical protein
MSIPPDDFMTPEGNALIAAFERGYRRGLEDAARIVEKYNEGRVWPGVAAAIRARIKRPRNTL